MSRGRLPPSVNSALRRLGEGIQLARRRRRVRQRDLATRMGVSVSTLRALESGAPGVSMGNLAMALLALGILSRLDDLTDPGGDDIGLIREIGELPQRVRIRKRTGRQGTGGSLAAPPDSEGVPL